MSIDQIKREITWYTDEIIARERDLGQTKDKIRELEGKITEAKRQLDLYKQDLIQAETVLKQKDSVSRE